MSIIFIVFDWIQSGITVLEQNRLQMLGEGKSPLGLMQQSITSERLSKNGLVLANNQTMQQLEDLSRLARVTKRSERERFCEGSLSKRLAGAVRCEKNCNIS
jgi:hypothetical protein